MIRNSNSDNSRTPRRHAIPHISAHADYRHDDYFFARNQSRAMEALEWQDGDDGAEARSMTPGLIVAFILLMISGLGFMLWEESRVHSGTGIGGTSRPLVERSGEHFQLRANPQRFPLSDRLATPKSGPVTFLSQISFDVPMVHR
jgi:hypothetical protein